MPYLKATFTQAIMQYLMSLFPETAVLKNGKIRVEIASLSNFRLLSKKHFLLNYRMNERYLRAAFTQAIAP